MLSKVLMTHLCMCVFIQMCICPATSPNLLCQHYHIQTFPLFGLDEFNLKRSERDELELLSLFLEGRVVGMRVASAGLMGEKTSIRSLTEGGWGGEVREGRGRGLLEEEKRESGHHVPTKLVVHIPLVSKVGQGRERTRHRGRRDREREDQVAQLSYLELTAMFERVCFSLPANI